MNIDELNLSEIKSLLDKYKNDFGIIVNKIVVLENERDELMTIMRKVKQRYEYLKGLN